MSDAEAAEAALPEPEPSAARTARRRVLSTSAGTHGGSFAPLDWAIFGSIGLIWGSSFLLIAIGLDAFAPGVVTWLRILLGAAALWLFPAARPRIDAHDRVRLLWVSILWVAIPFTLFPLAEEHIASGLTGLINGALPLLVATVGALMLRRAPSPLHSVGLLVGFAGVALIALPAAGEGSSEAIGVAMGLGAVLCYGFAVNIAAPLTQRYGSLPVMARMLAVASVLTAPFGLYGLADSSFAWDSAIAMVVLGVVGTGLAFSIFGRLVARVGATRAAFAIYLTPVVAVVLGAVFRDEAVRVVSIIGIGLVIAGAILASTRETRR